MTTFVDGPAKGQTLMLKRAPQFLRVTQEGGKFDALDQQGDSPKPEEQLFAYELVSQPTRCHIRASGGRGGFYVIASYRFVPTQPADAVLRSFQEWCRWCYNQVNMEEPVDL